MSDGVSIHPAGTADLLADQLDQHRQAARAAMQQATRVARDELARTAPGRIGEHIEEHVHSSLGAVTGTVYPTGAGVRYVEEGTGIYVNFHQPIRPTAARRAENSRAALRLPNGTFRRQVRGQRPQRFVERARAAAEPQVEEILERAPEKALRRLER